MRYGSEVVWSANDARRSSGVESGCCALSLDLPPSAGATEEANGCMAWRNLTIEGASAHLGSNDDIRRFSTLTLINPTTPPALRPKTLPEVVKNGFRSASLSKGGIVDMVRIVPFSLECEPANSQKCHTSASGERFSPSLDCRKGDELRPWTQGTVGTLFFRWRGGIEGCLSDRALLRT